MDAGKRISLNSIVYAFRCGQSPESIRRSFPLLNLEEIYGAIAFYLANQTEIDEYLVQEEKEFEKLRLNSQATIPFGMKRCKKRIRNCSRRNYETKVTSQYRFERR